MCTVTAQQCRYFLHKERSLKLIWKAAVCRKLTQGSSCVHRLTIIFIASWLSLAIGAGTCFGLYGAVARPVFVYPLLTTSIGVSPASSRSACLAWVAIRSLEAGSRPWRTNSITHGRDVLIHASLGEPRALARPRQITSNLPTVAPASGWLLARPLGGLGALDDPWWRCPPADLKE